MIAKAFFVEILVNLNFNVCVLAVLWYLIIFFNKRFHVRTERNSLASFLTNKSFEIDDSIDHAEYRQCCGHHVYKNGICRNVTVEAERKEHKGNYEHDRIGHLFFACLVNIEQQNQRYDHECPAVDGCERGNA